MQSVTTATEEETVAVGRRLAACLRVGDVVSLNGPLGTGKTRFARGIAEGLGYSGAVTSPTFTLLHEYPSSPAMCHVDAYRLADEDEFLALGVSEHWEDGVVVIEWGDRVRGALPRETLVVTGEAVSESRRRWTFVAADSRSAVASRLQNWSATGTQ